MKKWSFENVYYRLKDDQPYLLGSRCTACGYVSFPRKEVCPACVKKGCLEDIELSRTGKIDTFSVLHVAAPGFPVPYVVGYVRVEEGPRVFGIIQRDEESPDSLEIGQEAELVLGKICEDQEGNEIMGFQFRCVQRKRGERG